MTFRGYAPVQPLLVAIGHRKTLGAGGLACWCGETKVRCDMGAIWAIPRTDGAVRPGAWCGSKAPAHWSASRDCPFIAPTPASPGRIASAAPRRSGPLEHASRSGIMRPWFYAGGSAERMSVTYLALVTDCCPQGRVAPGEGAGASGGCPRAQRKLLGVRRPSCRQRGANGVRAWCHLRRSLYAVLPVAGAAAVMGDCHDLDFIGQDAIGGGRKGNRTE